MLMELIEKKGQSIKTKIKFTKKEWNKLPFSHRCDLSEKHEIHETARTVWFEVDGDLLNRR